jgi:hypothetical protein
MAAGSGAIALAAALAACGGSGSSPSVLPPLSTTPTASASTAPPADPKAAAVAVVKEYYRLLNEETSTSNAAALAGVMTPECPCQQVVAATKRVAKSGEHYFGRNTIRSLSPSVDSVSTVDVVVQYDYTPGGIKTADGRVISRTSARRGNLVRIVLSNRGSRWLIARIEILRNGTSP